MINDCKVQKYPPDFQQEYNSAVVATKTAKQQHTTKYITIGDSFSSTTTAISVWSNPISEIFEDRW